MNNGEKKTVEPQSTDPRAVREQIAAYRKNEPFRPFVITLKSGEKLVVTHRHGIAFSPSGDPDTTAGRWFAVPNGACATFDTFDGVASVSIRNGEE